MLDRRCFIASALLAGATAAKAQSGGPAIKLIVPFAAGGSTDLVARITGEALAARLGRSVIIENRPGAGVITGTNSVARADPDGTTLLFTTVSHAVNPGLNSRLPYDSTADFVPIAHVATAPLVLSVHPSVPAAKLGDFLAYVRANPGKVHYGSAGVGSVLHMAVELLKHQAGLDVVHVPYRGAAPAMTDLIAGHVQFIIDPISTSAQQIKSGAIRALAVTSAQRSPSLPDVPTFAEAGMADYEASTWNVILAPKGTPRDLVEHINRAANAAVRDPAIVRRLEQLDIIPIADSTPASTAAFIARETERWTAIIKASGIALQN
ncbi:Bug family tripartite tricarboxylate transporter substrate binding protein [Phreatobacter stygius]|uniref:Tripartite tricarboxylate transporter substrate binding protein n=1 Tax=Phreatobacter stygius TaxID=1940610 RepID=A0A4D7B8J1_9HYPH|nr:tripartite tricarboxylate transporter substrate binding protein [Phreatobacter stygius]QCI67163.1 tripartite tricarboxylate transporter substrate binding protein [Phreatobacter stygius]